MQKLKTQATKFIATIMSSVLLLVMVVPVALLPDNALAFTAPIGPREYGPTAWNNHVMDHSDMNTQNPVIDFNLG
ncbi:MAG: hypothetical protein HQL43_04320 [Alphaproteobacteria bacterium]|nr:hypothetical protein [Alphaproteobacteria bacterium]